MENNIRTSSLERLGLGPDKPAHAQKIARSRTVRLRSEVNGLIHPFFFLSKHGGSKKIEWRRTCQRGDQTVEVTWRVIPHPTYGRPGPLAHRVHRALEQLITERGLPIENPISFSIHDLCRRAGIATGGSEYRKVTQSLLAIKATQVESKGAFYAKAQTRYVDDVFSLYERLVLTGERLPNGGIAEHSYLWLGSWYLESLNALYVKPLDYRFYRDLRTPVARRLYELLGVKFYRVAGNRNPWIRYRYSTLCRLLPVTRRRYRSHVVQQLGTAHHELIEGGFLSAARIHTIPHARDGQDWHIKYYAGKRALSEISAVRTKARKS